LLFFDVSALVLSVGEAGGAPVWLIAQEVGALERLTSGHEAHSSGRKRAQLSTILAGGRGCAT
jgi:hypothetical protein